MTGHNVLHSEASRRVVNAWAPRLADAPFRPGAGAKTMGRSVFPLAGLEIENAASEDATIRCCLRNGPWHEERPRGAAARARALSWCGVVAHRRGKTTRENDVHPRSDVPPHSVIVVILVIVVIFIVGSEREKRISGSSVESFARHPLYNGFQRREGRAATTASLGPGRSIRIRSAKRREYGPARRGMHE